MASNEVADNLRKVRNDLKSLLAKAMNNACAVVRNDAIQNAPHGTGALQRSIDFQVSDDGTEGVIYSDLEYAPYVEVGTGIYATKGQGRDKPWVYPYYDHGSVNFARTVGQRPQPYLEPAIRQNTTKIRECFEGLLENEKL